MSVLGIDIGTSYCVLSTIQRGAVAIVRNDLSERLTPALVSFTDKERLIGEAAQTQLQSNFRNTARNIKQLLGCTSASSEDFLKETEHSLAELDFASGYAGYRVRYKGELQVMSAIRCMAALLTKLKDIGEKGTGAPVVDVVISVPGWFSEISRQAMVDAAEIAGLNCLRVMNEHAAVALDYGIYRSNTFDKETVSRVTFIGMGHGSANVCVTDYVKGELRVVAVGSDQSLGGRDIDRAVVKHFAQQFETQHKLNPFSNAKAVLKLEDAANRAKKVLSANLEAPFNIECLMEDSDIHGLLTRQTFEELCLPFRQRLMDLLRGTFAGSGISPDSVHHVEIVGGCTRIPWVQDTIVNFFNQRLPLSKTLNMDEAVARGCGLQAAMLTPRYRVREFTVVDRLFEPVTVSWLAGEETKTRLLFDTGSPLGTKKIMTFPLHSQFEIGLNAGTKGQPLISVIEPPKDGDVGMTDPSLRRMIKLRARLSMNAIVSWESAQLLVDEVDEEQPSTEKPSPDHPMPEATPEKQPQEGSTEKATSDEKPSSEHPPRSEEAAIGSKKKIKTMRFDCCISSQPRIGYLTAPMRREFKDAEMVMLFEDRKQQESKEMMNTFESYIYGMRSKLQGPLSDFATPTETTQLSAKLDEYEIWVYDNPEGSAELYASKLAELKAFGDPIEERQNARVSFNEAIDELAQTVSMLRASMVSSEFNHIEHARLQSLDVKVTDVEKWMQQRIAQVEKTPLHQDIKTSKAKDVSNESETLKNFAKTILTAKPVLEPKPIPADPDNVDMDGAPSTATTGSSMTPEATNNDVPM